MSVGAITESSEKSDKKKSDPADKHEDPKKDDDHKDGGGKTSDASHSGSDSSLASHLLTDSFGTSIGNALTGIKNAWSSFTGFGSHESLPKVELTDKNGATRVGDKQGAAGDKQGAAGEKPGASEKTDGNWLSNWWGSWRDIQSKNAEVASKLPDSAKAEIIAQRLATDDGWNRIVEGRRGSYDSRNPHGGTDRTTISRDGTDHQMADGSVGHTDARGTVIRDKNGMVLGSDAATGQTRETMPNGTDIVRNKDGSIDVTRDGVKIHVNKDGTIDQEVNGHHVVVDKNRVDNIVGHWHFRQDRGTNSPEEAWKEAHDADGKPSQGWVRDPDGRGMVYVINDGKGNTIDFHRNGDTVVTSADNPDTQLIQNEREQTTRIRMKGQEYWVQKQVGTDGQERYYLYDNKEHSGKPFGWVDADSGSIYQYDANDITKNGGQVGQLSSPVGADGRLRQGTAAAGDDGQTQLEGIAAEVEVKRNPDGTIAARTTQGDTTVTTTGDGTTSEVTVQNNRTGKTDATVVDAGNGSYQTKTDVQVDENGNAVLGPDGKIQGGSTVTESTGIDDKGQDHTRIGLGEENGQEQFLEERYNENGESSWWNSFDGSHWDENGNLVDSQGNVLRDDGSVLYSDGTEVDPDGRVSYNGETVYDSSEDWDDGGASVARVNAIIGLAASISASGIADPGKVGQLMELYSQLSNVAGMALQAGDLGAFMQADLAKAVISGAITEQQAAQARATIAEHFAGHPLTTGEIYQIQRGMNGTSAAEVQQFVKNSGWSTGSEATNK